jgi:uncharacterized protein
VGFSGAGIPAPGPLFALRRFSKRMSHLRDDLLRACSEEHPTRDAWWDDRDLVPLLSQVDIPVYLEADWTNVPMHLPGTFDAWDGLADNPNVRMSLLGAQKPAPEEVVMAWVREFAR